MKPILFNTDMVRAILEDRKTVTRRVVKPQPEGAHSILDCDEEKRTFDLLCGNGGVGGVFVDWAETIKAPFWPGDILYVRETWAEIDNEYVFRADDEIPEGWHLTAWRPSIHMPREAARIFLRVTNVRVERLQDITSEQIDAEGCKEYGFSVKTGELMPSSPCYFSIAWDNTIKPADRALYGWDTNPFVWVIEFERISRGEEEHNV